MEVKKETIQTLYELCRNEHHANASVNMRNACLICEKLLGLPAFSFLGSPELAKDRRRTHSAVLARLGFEIKEEEPAKSEGEPDTIDRYRKGGW